MEQIGCALPNQEVGTDTAALRAFLQGIQEIGYQHLVMPDHVTAGDPAVHTQGDLPFSVKSIIHEPLTLSAYIAAVAPGLELVPCVILLPQRQAALVAKQAAEVDVLSGGKLRLGIGVGRIRIEYDALGAEYPNRGDRMVEQMDLMRRLWTQETVNFEGRYHHLRAMGINPLPVQRPIPIWVGATQESALKRAALYGDGLFPLRRNHPQGGWKAALERVRGWMQEAGRDPSTFGVEARLLVGKGTPDDWQADLDDWRTLGLTHITVGTDNGPFPTVDAHLTRLREAYELVTSG
jgi:probable F420-dependent oxidoreductase